MKKLEEELQNTTKRWPLKERTITGAGGAAVAELGIHYVLNALGVNGNIFEGDYTRVLVMFPFGFVGAYAGLNCDRIINYYLRNRYKKAATP